MSDDCPSCKEPGIQPMGLGTELVEEDIKKLFPDIVVARADRDEISKREELENLIHRMEKKEIDVLVGTQMIAKGLDFPHLNLVGLVMADVGFHMPDFRASERGFQLITQVSGRAGRHSDDPGQVYLQNAVNEFSEYGAHAKVAQMEDKYGNSVLLVAHAVPNLLKP